MNLTEKETTEEKIMKATLTFPKREQAESFAIAWGRYSKTGHIVGSGIENVKVTVFDVTEPDKIWIDNYVSKLNELSNTDEA